MGEFDDLITELCRQHPRFRRVTITRLVSRTVDTCARTAPDGRPESLLSAVRETVEDQLRYVEEDRPVGPQRSPVPRKPRLPAQR